MVIVMDVGAREQDIVVVMNKLEKIGFQGHLIRGVNRIVIGAVGDRTAINSLNLEVLPGVEKVVPIMQPFKLVSREIRNDSTLIKVKNAVIGGKQPVVIAGPCAVESRDQLLTAARRAAAAGATILRGGTFKPRTSPYSFQGLQEEGLMLMSAAAKESGLATVTEVIDEWSLELALGYVDMVQVGARNMQNFKLLQAVGRCQKPVLLKRGLSATIEEWLMAAEYVVSEGNPSVVLCERGIRTFEKYTRNTLDLSAVPLVKGLTHLPVIVDPSHATGKRELVAPMSMAAIAAGADGLLVEMHPDPQRALCDGHQSLSPDELDTLMLRIANLKAAVSGVGA
ncbi:MAG: 3-deoxy-7-phosphoheptulonate synthase [Firmicutes bacterium]|nr:3-deoxy-7-phosphoheptulonate synthase [Bacillota bacterium]